MLPSENLRLPYKEILHREIVFDLRKLYRYLKFGVPYKFDKTLSYQKAYFYVYISGKCTFTVEENETPLDGTIFTCQDKFSSLIIFHIN